MGATPGVYRATYRDKHTGQLRKASTWIAAYWSPAKRRTVKEYGFTSAKAAQMKRAEVMSATARLDSTHESAATITLEQLLALVVTDYEMHARRSLKQTRARQKVLFETFGAGCLARNIDSAAIARHVQRMRADGYAPATINRSLALLKRGFRLARRNIPALVVPHIPMLKEMNARQGFFEPADLERIMAALPKHIRPVIRALHVTGWRSGEILSRRWADVEGGFLLLRPGETKNDRGRAFPLKPDLERIFAGIPGRRNPEDRIFGDVTAGHLRRAWDEARASVGLPGRLVHDLRRTAARDLIRAGVDRDTAKRMLGHETDSIFTRYRIVAGDDLKNAAALLSAYRASSKRPRRRAA